MVPLVCHQEQDEVHGVPEEAVQREPGPRPVPLPCAQHDAAPRHPRYDAKTVARER